MKNTDNAHTFVASDRQCAHKMYNAINTPWNLVLFAKLLPDLSTVCANRYVVIHIPVADLVQL